MLWRENVYSSCKKCQINEAALLLASRQEVVKREKAYVCGKEGWRGKERAENEARTEPSLTQFNMNLGSAYDHVSL